MVVSIFLLKVNTVFTLLLGTEYFPCCQLMLRKWQNWKFSCHWSHWWVCRISVYICIDILYFVNTSTCVFFHQDLCGLISLNCHYSSSHSHAYQIMHPLGHFIRYMPPCLGLDPVNMACQCQRECNVSWQLFRLTEYSLCHHSFIYSHHTGAEEFECYTSWMCVFYA